MKHALQILILQHPQERTEDLGSAGLVSEVLDNVIITSGLSWPNFEQALGRKVDPKKWAVLYLGSSKIPDEKDLVFIDRLNKPIDNDAAIKAAIEGIVALDGTWSQAKTLWWRNPWLLKLNRIAIKPFQPSLYGKLRKEPRRESVSTLEAIASTLVALGEPIEISKALLARFRLHLDEYRSKQKASSSAFRVEK